jgi:hypothetical protein
VDANVVRGWHIRRVSWREERYDSAHNRLTTVWRIQGYRSFVDADASEVLTDLLLDRLALEFRADPTLSGAVADCRDGEREGAQLVDSGPVMFCGLLCHGVTLEIVTVQLVELGVEPPVCDGKVLARLAWVMAGEARPPEVIDAEDNINLGIPVEGE